MKTAVGGRCAFCGRAFLSTDAISRKVEGWERLRDQGGANAIARRTEIGKLAHTTCVDDPLMVEGQLQLGS